MANKMARLVVVVVGMVAVTNLWQPAFVPLAGRPVNHALPIYTAAGAAALLGALPAFAGPVDDAAKKLAGASYPLVQAIDWTKNEPLTKYMASGASANKAAMSAVLDLSLALDPALIKTAVEAHKKAVEASDAQMRTPLANHEEVTVALANMLASAPAAKVFAIFGAVPNLQQLNQDWLGTLNPADANAAYAAFLQTAQAVKR